MSTEIVSRCVDCSGEFTAEQVAGKYACPACGSQGIPMSPAEDVEIKINWHELRILSMWAENWANHIGSEVGERRPPIQTVFAIVKRLQDQFPLKAPLTLSGELEQLKQEQPNITVHGNITPGAPLPMDSEKEQ